MLILLQSEILIAIISGCHYLYIEFAILQLEIQTALKIIIIIIEHIRLAMHALFASCNATNNFREFSVFGYSS